MEYHPPSPCHIIFYVKYAYVACQWLYNTRVTHSAELSMAQFKGYDPIQLDGRQGDLAAQAPDPCYEDRV